jgi:hypothetical protein
MFVDERIESGLADHRLIVGSIVCSRQRWMIFHGEAARIRATRAARRLDEIGQLLDRLQGFALIAWADLPKALVQPGELDGAADIPRMKRWDNVWCQGVLAAAAAVLACLRTSGVESVQIDLYYDPKSLTLAHRDAFENTLREALPEIAREDPETSAIQSWRPLTFGRIEQIPKRQGGTEADHLQQGTSLAHHLCSQAGRLIGSRTVSRVVVRNNTAVLRSMISKFTDGPTNAR